VLGVGWRVEYGEGMGWEERRGSCREKGKEENRTDETEEGNGGNKANGRRNDLPQKLKNQSP
jgi:hypothetical protein